MNTAQLRKEAIARYLTALRVEGDKAPAPVNGGRAARQAVRRHNFLATPRNA